MEELFEGEGETRRVEPTNCLCEDAWQSMSVWGRLTNLDVFVESAENVVDLILEATRQHLIGFIENEHLDVAGA